MENVILGEQYVEKETNNFGNSGLILVCGQLDRVMITNITFYGTHRLTMGKIILSKSNFYNTVTKEYSLD